MNISVAAKGVEETAIFQFVSPNQNDDNAPELYSILGDLYGFRHDDVNKAPKEHFGDFKSTSIDCAALDYNYVVRATDEDAGTIWYSTDGTATWEKTETLPWSRSTATRKGRSAPLRKAFAQTAKGIKLLSKSGLF